MFEIDRSKIKLKFIFDIDANREVDVIIDGEIVRAKQDIVSIVETVSSKLLLQMRLSPYPKTWSQRENQKLIVFVPLLQRFKARIRL